MPRPLSSSLGTLATLVILGLAGAGCYDPAPANGMLLCSNDGACPSGFHCASDSSCWRDGTGPLPLTAADAHAGDDAASPHSDAAADQAMADLAAGDLAVLDLVAAPDVAVPPDLLVVDLLPPPDLVPAGLAAPCAAGTDCASGNCVDGVCCDLPAAQCGGCLQCNRADSMGTCSTVAAGADPHHACALDVARCKQASCRGDGTCNAPVGTPCGPASCGGGVLTALSCDGNAACSSGMLSCGGYACSSGSTCAVVCADDSGCVAGYYCDKTGHCAGRAQPGTPCAAADQCLSNFCVDGVCCALAACVLRCTSCAAGGGLSCSLVAAGAVDPTGQCKDDATTCQRSTCDIAGNCQPASANTQCAGWSCANSYVAPPRFCDGNSLACPTPTASPCPGRLACRDAVACSPACAANADCVGQSCCRNGACFDATLPTSCGPACGDCTAPNNIGHACVAAANCGCTSDVDCAGIAARPRCNNALGVCVPCLTAADCSPAAPNCVNNNCAPCGSNGDCVSDGWGNNCRGAPGACTCFGNNQCIDPAGRAKRCDNNVRACVCGSTGAPCPVGKFCSDSTANATCL